MKLTGGGSDSPRPGDVDIVIGGPPCQGFSGYNRYSKSDDPRNSLVDVFIDFVSFLQPRYVIMENVPGLLSMNNGAVIEEFLMLLTKLDTKVNLAFCKQATMAFHKIGGEYLLSHV